MGICMWWIESLLTLFEYRRQYTVPNANDEIFSGHYGQAKDIFDQLILKMLQVLKFSK